MNCRSIILFTLLVISVTTLRAQEGYPFISGYSFNRVIDRDNFDMVQDRFQNLILANRKGIIVFNSRDWQLVPLQSFPVTLENDPYSGDVYAGCINGYGKLEKGSDGLYRFIWLSETDSTGQITSVHFTENEIHFINENRLFTYVRNTSENILTELGYRSVKGSFSHNAGTYLLFDNNTLGKPQSGELKPFNARGTIPNEIVSYTSCPSGQTLLGTGSSKVVLFNGSGFSSLNLAASEYLDEAILNGLGMADDHIIVISTLLGGIILADLKTGNTEAIINQSSGLPDDEVFCISIDSNKGIWAAHRLGLSRIDTGLPLHNFSWYPGLTGTPVDAEMSGEGLYVASSDGLFRLEEKKEYRESLIREKVKPENAGLIKGTDTEVKPDIKETNNMASEVASEPESLQSGQKELSRRELRKQRKEQRLSPSSQENTETKAEVNTPVEKSGEGKSFTGLLNLFRSGQEYTISEKKVYSLVSVSHAYRKINEVSGKIREMSVHSGSLIVITSTGVYSIENGRVKNLAGDILVKFASFPKGETDDLLIGTTGGVWKISRIGREWIETGLIDVPGFNLYSAEWWNGYLWLGSDSRILKLSLDEVSNITSVTPIPVVAGFNDEIHLKTVGDSLFALLSSGIYKIENDVPVQITAFEEMSDLPEYYPVQNGFWIRSGRKWSRWPANNDLAVRIAGIFDDIRTLSEDVHGNTWIVSKDQVFRISKKEQAGVPQDFSVYIENIKGEGNTAYNLELPEISYSGSSIRISFSAPFFLSPENTEYSYRLIGASKEWSPWNYASQVEYPILPPGNYTLEVKARNIMGIESKSHTLAFRVKPPFWQTPVFIIPVIVLIGLGVMQIIRFREKSLRQAKKVLEEKVRERTAEIESQKNEISLQKKEITDSIYYALRIQQAAIPSDEKLKSILPEHFVLFLPRNIVSGDFYWLGQVKERTVLVAADCTGHGVPGAFMSMLGISFLNEIINRLELVNAAAILNELRKLVIATLNRDESDIQASDGMDLSLCLIDRKKMELQFAGAFNPLYMIRNNEMKIIKADKMPIGWFDRQDEFTNHNIRMQKGDCFYMASDGFIDQFGGKECKKYLSKPFREFLLSIHTKPMSIQKELVFNEFEQWKNGFEQVDDLLVMGFRI